MGYFQRHVFFCLNARTDGRECCQAHGASAVFEHAKKRVHGLGLSGEGKLRINKAGCLDRCALGPVLVVYPEAVWYTYVDSSDIDEIIDTHLIGGQIVERLRLPDPAA